MFCHKCKLIACRVAQPTKSTGGGDSVGNDCYGRDLDDLDFQDYDSSADSPTNKGDLWSLSTGKNLKYQPTSGTHRHRFCSKSDRRHTNMRTDIVAVPSWIEEGRDHKNRLRVRGVVGSLGRVPCYCNEAVCAAGGAGGARRPGPECCCLVSVPALKFRAMTAQILLLTGNEKEGSGAPGAFCACFPAFRCLRSSFVAKVPKRTNTREICKSSGPRVRRDALYDARHYEGAPQSPPPEGAPSHLAPLPALS
ncbi:hypothetical protein EVAR_82437_1 [Eumeta japonica]|uniref:Uncharacterized protein n=1 Tax=Eumeta variegata TaxID=151549 RepID=A0A4C1YK68_EUMVA|nr:hypothetical protein EVAR_82437_1 [Eumeta japonica]